MTPNVLGIAEVRAFENRQYDIVQRLIAADQLIYFRQPHFGKPLCNKRGI
ncbi:MAG: hypothetical protein M3342_21590 [Bacteroidota bacterium]|nr:hypothetical protein [Bacteroidota bacterium]